MSEVVMISRKLEKLDEFERLFCGRWFREKWTFVSIWGRINWFFSDSERFYEEQMLFDPLKAANIALCPWILDEFKPSSVQLSHQQNKKIFVTHLSNSLRY